MSPIAPSRQTPATIPSQRDVPSLRGLGLPDALIRAITKLYGIAYDIRDYVFTQGGQACLVYAANLQTTIASSSPTAIQFDTGAFDSAGAWPGSGGKLQINQPGVYGVVGAGSFQPSGAGTFRQVFLRVNGSINLSTTTLGVTAAYFGPPATIWRFNKGDYVELVQNQDTGGGLGNVVGQVSANLGIVRLTN